MGPIAASGGYLVSTPGKRIFAQPNTLTGSIGVLAGKIFNVDLLERLFINREIITRGEGAQFFDFERPFNDEEKAVVLEQIQRIYDLFLERVSESRDMERQVVEDISGGRVWTGKQALENGLVDELGGLTKALSKAREMGGLSDRAPVRLYYPEDKHPLAPITSASSGLRYIIKGLRLLNRSAALCLCPWVDSTGNRVDIL
jgi:protease-4